jgi:hypothetical protein
MGTNQTLIIRWMVRWRHFYTQVKAANYKEVGTTKALYIIRSLRSVPVPVCLNQSHFALAFIRNNLEKDKQYNKRIP